MLTSITSFVLLANASFSLLYLTTSVVASFLPPGKVKTYAQSVAFDLEKIKNQIKG